MCKRAIIIGAGPVGLVTAWQLLENDWSVTIFEKDEIVGGMCRTWKWGDYLVDTGPHIFHTPDNSLSQFWEKHFGDLFIKGDFWCKNVGGEKFDEYWDYPLSWESISRYPLELKTKILAELNSLNNDKKARAINYSEYMEAEVGPTLQKMFFKTYPEKIWGVSTEEMTPDWAPKRIEFRNKVTPFYHKQWNAVGKYGTGCVYERIRDKIIKLGGIFEFDHRVDKFTANEKVISEIIFSNGKKLKVDKEDKIVSSLPITLTAEMLGYKSKLSFRGIRSVYLAYDTPEILPEGIHWLYYGSNKIDFNRVTEPKKLSPYVSSNHQSYLTAEITFSKNDDIDLTSSENLVEQIAQQIAEVGLITQDKLVEGSTNKEYSVYPLQYTGYQEELSKTRSIISRYQQLFSIGTGGDYNYADSQILFHKAFDTVSLICDKDSHYTQTIRKIPPVDLNEKVYINETLIGDGEKTYIIAEAGLNHNGSLEVAKELIDEAKKAQCNAIKFQTFQANKRISSKVKAVKYAETITGIEETLDEMFNRLAMPFEDQKKLFKYAKKLCIEVFSTPFDFDSVDFLEELGVSVYKIASMDLVNIPLIRYVAKTKKTLIISTGMSTIGQIEEAVDAVREEGNKNLILLHCNSSYPASPNEMNLKVMDNLKRVFKVPVGLSDHTFGLFVSHTAIALGANVIERHFTLDRSFEGPDHILSSEPEEMSELVTMSKAIPSIIGDGVKRVQPNEFDTINTQRKSLYASCIISKGDTITEKMIAIKGPGGGLLPKYLDIVVGRIATTDIEADYPITWENI